VPFGTLFFLLTYAGKYGTKDQRGIEMRVAKSFILVSLVFTSCCESQFYLTTDCEAEERITQNISYEVHGRLWTKKELVVCWEDTNSLSEDDREYLHYVVEEGWDKQISLDFVGWNLCSKILNPDIIIYNESIGKDPKTHASYAGFTQNFGMPKSGPNVVRVNFDGCEGKLGRNRCWRHLLLHEFGHVLNLVHEQTRPDTPKWCLSMLQNEGYQNQSLIEKDQQLVGPWDNDSIMNYCNSATDRPSCWDIAQVQMYYEKQ
jgi:hypothetical protein